MTYISFSRDMKFSKLLNNAENIDNKVLENVIRSWKSPGKVQEFWVLLGVGTLMKKTNEVFKKMKEGGCPALVRLSDRSGNNPQPPPALTGYSE